MKKNFMKTAVAAVCVVAAGMGGFKAYNTANQSQADMLLAENVEALSGNEYEDCILYWCVWGNGMCIYACGNLRGGCGLADNRRTPWI